MLLKLILLNRKIEINRKLENVRRLGQTERDSLSFLALVPYIT
ncbi:hypothetical protein NUACC26_048730 [Scytonema sp. NUACC26]